jgi:KaiC/GvpD/RAD55 family RecA-like ATPase
VTGANGTPGDAALEVLRDRDVFLWPDFDEPGRKHMTRIAERIAGTARSVRVLTLGERPGDDAVDFFERGGTTERLDQLLSDSQQWVNPDGAEDSATSGHHPDSKATRIPTAFRRPAEILTAIPRPRCRFLVPAFPTITAATRGGFPTGIVVVIVGWPDAGKTGLGTQIVLHIAMHYECVAVIFAPDGGQEATAIRIGGLLGIDQDKLEAREAAAVAELDELLRERRIFIVDDTQEGMAYENVRSHAETIRPDLPHIYLVDSAQEALATEDSDELDERHRVIDLMRSAYRTAEANPIPSTVFVTSQSTGLAFTPAKKGDRTPRMGAPAESKKVSYLCHMMIALEGDPSREPDFGSATVVKSKLRGPKPTFGLRVDPATSRLTEIDPAVVEQVETDRKHRGLEARVARIADRIVALLAKAGPLLVQDIRERVSGDKSEIAMALDGLEAQGVAKWEAAGKTGRGRAWSLIAGAKEPKL